MHVSKREEAVDTSGPGKAIRGGEFNAQVIELSPPIS